MTLNRISACFVLLAACALLGCGQSPTASTQGSGGSSASYIAETEPANPKGVRELIKASKNDEEVTMVGRIGGSASPFVEGLAAFSIVDPAIPYCKGEEGCPTPWDYCCELEKMKENKALVKVVDGKGTPVAKGAKDLLGVKELTMVVVRGKAKRDAEGNLTVLAEKVFIKK